METQSNAAFALYLAEGHRRTMRMANSRFYSDYAMDEVVMYERIEQCESSNSPQTRIPGWERLRNALIRLGPLYTRMALNPNPMPLPDQRQGEEDLSYADVVRKMYHSLRNIVAEGSTPSNCPMIANLAEMAINASAAQRPTVIAHLEACLARLTVEFTPPTLPP